MRPILGKIFMFISIATIFFVLVSIAHSLDDQQSSYIDREGMWPAFEQERHLIFLRELLYRISLGDVINKSDYQFRLGVALDRVNQSQKFFSRVPDLPIRQRETLQNIDRLIKTIQRADQQLNDQAPDRETAKNLISLLDQVISLSHDMVNYRRDDTYRNNRELFNNISRIRIFEIAAFIAMVVLGIWMYFSERSSNQQLRTIMSQAEDLTIEQERNRVAREIHDGLGHQLYAIKTLLTMTLHQIKNDTDAATVSCVAAREQVIVAQSELQQSVRALKEPPNKSLITQRLQDLVRDCELSGIHTLFEVSGDQYILPTPVHHAVYRITQESLTNIQRHSMAQNVSVAITFAARSFQMEIKDDGVGLSKKKHDGQGLRNMHDRVMLVNGSISIDNITPRGVRVWVSIPIR